MSQFAGCVEAPFALLSLALAQGGGRASQSPSLGTFCWDTAVSRGPLCSRPQESANSSLFPPLQSVLSKAQFAGFCLFVTFLFLAGKLSQGTLRSWRPAAFKAPQQGSSGIYKCNRYDKSGSERLFIACFVERKSC